MRRDQFHLWPRSTLHTSTAHRRLWSVERQRLDGWYHHDCVDMTAISLPKNRNYTTMWCFLPWSLWTAPAASSNTAQRGLRWPALYVRGSQGAGSSRLSSSEQNLIYPPVGGPSALAWALTRKHNNDDNINVIPCWTLQKTELFNPRTSHLFLVDYFAVELFTYVNTFPLSSWDPDIKGGLMHISHTSMHMRHIQVLHEGVTKQRRGATTRPIDH